VNVSQVDCGCNAAGYFINMPGYNAQGQPDKAGGDYYCDANDKGHYCPEMDTFEGNKYTFATTLHTCNSPNNKHYDWCDGGGCQANAFNVDSSAFGPGKKIDTSKTFRITHSFGVKEN